MMKHQLLTVVTVLTFVFSSLLSAQQEVVTVQPHPYVKALRNPMKGFTTNGIKDHPWGSLAFSYIKWNELENHESDGIEKIISVCNRKWGNVADKNVKVIPRVYLHWDGDKKYWPADMQEDDYSSEQFRKRVLRLIERLGVCWDNDPRVAFVEMGIFGKWGEQHSPFPTPEMEKLVGDAFAAAFKHKKVSVRRNWERFKEHPYGEYWDSWAHYDQMYRHGDQINKVNETGRYKDTYIGGEAAYNWGNSEIQPGASPTESVSDPHHRDFVINSIRWLHCTQLRWIDAYDRNNAEAVAGAEEVQKALGYRYELKNVEFSLNDLLHLSFEVINTGSAPFYYDWPVEVALLDTVTHQPVWRSTFDSADIRNWLPGKDWTDPDWIPSDSWAKYYPDVNWNNSGITAYAVPPPVNKVQESFLLDAPEGTYFLSLSILDPAGDLPGIRFATANYLEGGRHPVGLVSLGKATCAPLPGDFKFDHPGKDLSLYYDDAFEFLDIPDSTQTPLKDI